MYLNRLFVLSVGSSVCASICLASVQMSIYRHENPKAKQGCTKKLAQRQLQREENRIQSVFFFFLDNPMSIKPLQIPVT
ncbi:hypothetical protein QR685DRAFT_358479 [Neurospora intermedia]|uniref:Secreted protein n=1 Tax=Neurospora intermedia TaxID=5142 RepID=A0ABR3D3Y5_NEUIN